MKVILQSIYTTANLLHKKGIIETHAKADIRLAIQYLVLLITLKENKDEQKPADCLGTIIAQFDTKLKFFSTQDNNILKLKKFTNKEWSVVFSRGNIKHIRCLYLDFFGERFELELEKLTWLPLVLYNLNKNEEIDYTYYNYALDPENLIYSDER